MRIRAELAVSAPAQDAWAVAGERFGEIGGWAPAVTRSGMDGRPHPAKLAARAGQDALP